MSSFSFREDYDTGNIRKLLEMIHVMTVEALERFQKLSSGKTSGSSEPFKSNQFFVGLDRRSAVAGAVRATRSTSERSCASLISLVVEDIQIHHNGAAAIPIIARAGCETSVLDVLELCSVQSRSGMEGKINSKLADKPEEQADF